MPATSEAQRRLFGAVLAYKRGQMKNASGKIKKVAEGVSEEQAGDFARKTKQRHIAKSLLR